MTTMPTTAKTSRLLSIDAYRAFTMLLMIFVNDTWTLVGIPQWIGHLPAEADGLGLADVVFPAFLFIVGLSVPFAIRNRIKQGDTTWQVWGHIAIRALALIIMGIFHVNLEQYAAAAPLSRPAWQLLATIGFFLVWLDYANPKAFAAKLLRAVGAILLLGLALLYRQEGGNGGWMQMQTHWWGILGLIGWSYLLVASIFLLSKGKGWVQVAALVFFVVFNMFAQSSLLSGWAHVKAAVWIVEDGALPALTMCGVVVSLMYTHFRDSKSVFLIWAIGLAMALILLGLLARMEWNISKIWATPSFTLVTAGISVAGFVVMVYIVEVWQRRGWYRWISPAGTSTLTCYLLPYAHYALLGFIGWQLPEVLRTGGLGIAKSLLYALAIIALTGLLERWRIRLKL